MSNNKFTNRFAMPKVIKIPLVLSFWVYNWVYVKKFSFEPLRPKTATTTRENKQIRFYAVSPKRKGFEPYFLGPKTYMLKFFTYPETPSIKQEINRPDKLWKQRIFGLFIYILNFFLTFNFYQFNILINLFYFYHF